MMTVMDEAEAVATAVDAHDRALAELAAGDVPAARAEVSRAVELLTLALGAAHPNVLKVLITASQIEQAAGELTAARIMAADAVEASRTWGLHADAEKASRTWDLDDADLVTLRFEAEVVLAGLDQTLGDLDAAEARIFDALAEANTVDSAARSVLLLTNALGVTYKFAGRLDDAQRCYDQVYDLLQAEPSPDPADLAGLFHNLAGSRGDAASGILWAKRGIAIRSTLGDAARLALARDYGSLAALHHLAGHVEQARDSYAKAEGGFVAAIGPDHYEVGVVLANRAALEAEYGDPEAALDLYRRALTSLFAALGPAQAEVLLVRSYLRVLVAST